MTPKQIRSLIMMLDHTHADRCHSESSEIIIGNMEINKDNRVKDKCLYSIEADDIRFSCYYSTIVKQRKISKGEYEYYQEKIRLNEEMGGLFVPQPSELPSNIRCESSNKQAIGYVGVSLNVAEYRIFISTDNIQYRLPEGYCQGAKGLKEEYTFFRFILDGVYHCISGPGPTYGIQRLCMGFWRLYRRTLFRCQLGKAFLLAS